MANHSCLSNLSPRVPSEWRSSNFTTAACAAPDCDDNRVAFETCCNVTIASFDPSSQSRGNGTTAGEVLQFLSCSISFDTSNWDPLSTKASPYLDYQNCLLREGSEFFKCNMPQGETLDDCPVGMRTGPIGHGEIDCATENRPGAASALGQCCSSEPGVYGYGCYGCYTWCSGGSELQQCIDDTYGREIGPAIFCQNSTNASNSASGDQATGGDEDSGNHALESGAALTSAKTMFMVCALCTTLLTELLR